MIVSFKTITLLIFVLILALTNAQDSTQTPTTPNTTQAPPPPVTSDSQLSSSHPASTQSQPNPENTTATPQATNINPNIVTNEVHPSPSQPQEGHHENVANTHQQPHSTQHEAPAEHHQGEQHDYHEKIHQALQQMTDQQLKVFEDSLEGQARKYYDELMKQDQNEQHASQAQYQEEYKQVQHELTKTNIEFNKEDDQFHKERTKFAQQMINYNQYLFQLDEGNNQDFKISIPNAQQVIFHGYTYENNDGTYAVTSDIQEQEPITIAIYENNHRIVYQKPFYFKYSGSFLGNDNCTYLIRFINPSQHKLIALNIGVMFENGHIADKLTVHDVADHGRRLNVFRNDVSNKYTDMSMKSVIENENRQTLINKLDHYFTYSIVEIVMILILCVLQVEFVKKLLSTNNVV